MTDPVVMTALGIAAAAVGVLGKASFDKRRNGRNGHSATNGTPVRQVISERDELVFQTTMKMAIEGISTAIERGHERTLDRMTIMTAAMTDAAAAIREVHGEIKAHRDLSAPAIAASIESARLVREIHGQVHGPRDIGRYVPPIPGVPL